MLDNDVVFLLDNMVAAVEVGFSYDNIVSIPAVGLEDVARRRGVADSADKGLIRKPMRFVRHIFGAPATRGPRHGGPGSPRSPSPCDPPRHDRGPHDQSPPRRDPILRDSTHSQPSPASHHRESGRTQDPPPQDLSPPPSSRDPILRDSTHSQPSPGSRHRESGGTQDPSPQDPSHPPSRDPILKDAGPS